MHFLNWVEKEQLQTRKTHPGMCDLIIREYKINNLGTPDSPHITQSVACKNSCFSLLFTAEDVCAEECLPLSNRNCILMM